MTWLPRLSARQKEESSEETSGELPVAAAGSDGRARHVRHHELVPLLSARGICLSPSQVHRLVTGTPERLSLPVFAALCDIFTTDPSELITTEAANVSLRKKVTASGESLSPATLAALRPTRAR